MARAARVARDPPPKCADTSGRYACMAGTMRYRGSLQTETHEWSRSKSPPLIDILGHVPV
eukprot:239014-Chlamydomonas_euryale.AAC.2